MSLKITTYSCDDKGTISKTANVCDVIDKMIRLTAKLTERYASDIVYDIAGLESAVQTGNRIDHLLFFRENGVETRKTEKLTESEYDVLLFNFTPIQVWRLTHDPIEMETKLIRVHVYKGW